jgi:hypothetical protein
MDLRWHHLMLLWWHRVLPIMREHVNVLIFIFIVLASLVLEICRTFVLVRLAIL